MIKSRISIAGTLCVLALSVISVSLVTAKPKGMTPAQQKCWDNTGACFHVCGQNYNPGPGMNRCLDDCERKFLWPCLDKAGAAAQHSPGRMPTIPKGSVNESAKASSGQTMASPTVSPKTQKAKNRH